MFYIKKLKSQELGSGANARGRYFYISKKVISFFPPLGKTFLNDTAIIPIINYSLSKTKSIYSAYVYHNDKYSRPSRNDAKASRDEYRLYLNSDVDPDSSYFNVDDIIVMKELSTKYSYVMYRFTTNSIEYNELETLINNSNIKGDHALVNDLSQIEDFEYIEHNVSKVIPIDVSNKVIATINNNKAKFDDDELSSGAHLFTSDTFRNFILNSYGSKCAITGKAIKWHNFNNLEAAHIKPKSHAGPFLPSNGICMSRNMHWAFDKGFFSIDDDLTINVHPEIIDTELNEYHGKKIFEPIDTFFKPNIKYLKYHKENVFGLFKHSGSIRKPSL